MSETCGETFAIPTKANAQLKAMTPLRVWCCSAASSVVPLPMGLVSVASNQMHSHEVSIAWHHKSMCSNASFLLPHAGIGFNSLTTCVNVYGYMSASFAVIDFQLDNS